MSPYWCALLCVGSNCALRFFFPESLRPFRTSRRPLMHRCLPCVLAVHYVSSCLSKIRRAPLESVLRWPPPEPSVWQRLKQHFFQESPRPFQTSQRPLIYRCLLFVLAVRCVFSSLSKIRRAPLESVSRWPPPEPSVWQRLEQHFFQESPRPFQTSQRPLIYRCLLFVLAV